MSRKLLLAAAIALAITAALSAADKAAPGPLSVGLSGGLSAPVDQFSSDLYYSPGLGVLLDAEYRVSSVPLLYLKGGAGYRSENLWEGFSLSIVEAFAGAGARLDIIPLLSVKGYLTLGYHYGILVLPWGNETGGALAARAGVDAQFNVLPSLGITVGGAYVWDAGVFSGIQGVAGVRYTFGTSTARPGPAVQTQPPEQKPRELAPAQTQPAPQPTVQTGALVLTASFDTIFPVFHAWYDTNPLGSVLIKNNGKETATNIRVSFLMKQYMDGKYTSEPVAKLDPGKEISVPLCALFNPSILDINTPTKALGEITVDYQAGGKALQSTVSASVALQNRNAMTWIDNQRPAAFVTSMEPSVVTFARNVASAVKGKGSSAINANLCMAMAIHEALGLSKLVYMVDPKSPYTERVKTKAEVDWLQFPRETLAYKAGDCDDLTILYSALLESLAVETAFVTIPGHIYIAFATGGTPEEARRQFQRADELIFEGDKAWIPIEVTSRDDFLTAWQTGAKEWRENKARGQAMLYPVSAAWQRYQPVNLPKDSAAPAAAPASSDLLARYLDVQLKFIDREIYEKKATLTAEITRTKESPKSVNSLGVLYATYGLYDKAETEFKRACAKTEYTPALQNLGTIAMVKKDYTGSLAYFERARKQDPHSALTLLGIARVNHELENYGSVRTAYDELKRVSPDVAAEFAYLDLRGEEATRAADITGAKEKVQWADQ